MINSLYDCFKHWSKSGSVYLISDTHFEDNDCKLMDKNWITPQEHINKIKKKVHKNDTLIHLGDVGNPEWLDQLKCYKVLITGNHDKPSLLRKHFNEVYAGPLFIAPKLLLSHEPIALDFCYNIHGHCHNGEQAVNALNIASNVINYEVVNLGELIKKGIFSKIDDLHRQTIDKATANKKEKANNE